MSNEEQFLTRSDGNRRSRAKKEKAAKKVKIPKAERQKKQPDFVQSDTIQTEPNHKSTTTNRILNALIAIVSILIIISLVLIMTNENVLNDVKNKKQGEASSGNEPAETLNNNVNSITADGKNSILASSKEEEDTSTNDEKEEEDKSTDSVDGEKEEEDESTDAVDDENGDEAKEDEASEGKTEEDRTVKGKDDNDAKYAHITVYESSDPIVTYAWTNERWAPFKTEQIGEHRSMYAADHIDYQEKLKLLYQDTGFTDETSILWSFKNSNGNAVAVISTLDRKEIYRVSMKWMNQTGWQTILMEQLITIAGAY